MASGGVSLCFAALSGLCATISVNVLAYPTQLEERGARAFPAWQKRAFVLLNVLFGFAGAACFLVSLRSAPVSLVMPLSNAAGLLTNMAAQMALGMRRYTKAMRVGTLVLACAVLVLVDVGPRDQDADPRALLSTPSGVACTLGQFAVLLAGGVLVRRRARDPPSSTPKVLAYAAVVSSSTVLAASCGKVALLLLDRGGAALVLFLGVYALVAGVSMAGDAAACARADTALYVPLNYCAQLLLNCLMGLCVWQDEIGDRVAYGMVYALLVLGVYEISAVDALRGYYAYAALSARLSQGRPVSAFGAALTRLALAWARGGEGEGAVRAVLESGLAVGAFGDQELLELGVRLLARQENAAEPLLAWAEQHVELYRRYGEKDPAFVQLLGELARREALSERSAAALQAMQARDAAPEQLEMTQLHP